MMRGRSGNTMNKPFQRKGAESNTKVGRDFESNACAFLRTQGMQLRPGLAVEIGINGHKPHKFDLGDQEKKVIVECKAHTWTEGGNVPSAKMTAWNQAMFFFCAAPVDYRKILFVLRDFSHARAETLGQYYIRTNPHLIPKDVEIWEFDERNGTAERIK